MTDLSPSCLTLKNCKKRKLSRGLEPPTSALPRRRATDCAKTAYVYGFHTQGLIYTNHSELSREICYDSGHLDLPSLRYGILFKYCGDPWGRGREGSAYDN